MNVSYAFPAPTSTSSLVLSDLRDFTLDNVDQLDWLLRASCADEQLAALHRLVEDFHDDSAFLEDAYLILREIRDQLQELPIHNPFALLWARPDLDASIRWLGARLDDLLSDTDEM